MDYDLHGHTEYSYDATAPVRDVFRCAQARGVSVIAFTDHHNMDCFHEAAAVAREFGGVRCILGMEASVSTAIGPIDVVCLGLCEEDAGELERPVVARYREWMREHNAALLRAAGKVGVRFDREDAERLLARRPERLRKLQGEVRFADSVLRDDFLARGIIEYPSDYNALMERLCRAERFPPYPPAGEALPLLAARGALLIYAHPNKTLAEMGRDGFVGLMSSLGIHGVEAGHPVHSTEIRDEYVAVCVEAGLLPSAGTDLHHVREYEMMFGGHRGLDGWARAILERLTGGR